MKKNYIQPSIKAVTVRVEGMVCLSPVTIMKVNSLDTKIDRGATIQKYGEEYEDEIGVAW